MARLVDLYDRFLFDLDGLIDPPDEPVPFATETLRTLSRAIFISASATATPVDVAAMLAGLGVPAHRGRVVTQSQAAARLVTGLVPARSAEFVLGTTPPTRAEDEPAYPPLLRMAMTGARFPLVVTSSLACVAAARAMRLPSVLLLTPWTDLTEVLLVAPEARPTYVATDMRDLLRHQPIVNCDARFWSCEEWIASVSVAGELRLHPGPMSALAAGARVMCAAAWNWPGSGLDVTTAVEQFMDLVSSVPSGRR
ncbi:hypothetical protein GCM10029964_109050 [Kibdelosporangium lantanae]